MKLSKEKKQQLILATLCALMVCGGLWYGLIGYQDRRLAEIMSKVDEAGQKELKASRLIGNRSRIEADLESKRQKLTAIESTFAEGDLYSWFILRLKEFQLSYRVDTPQISREVVGDVNLLPDFPYRQATYSVRGTAFFHDLGRFVADFENRFPYSRILNLQMDADVSALTPEEEKVTFKCDISTLLKPAATMVTAK